MMSMICVFQNLLESAVCGCEKSDLAVFAGGVEKIDEARIVLDQFIQNLVMCGIGKEFENSIVDIFEMRIRMMSTMTRPMAWRMWMRTWMFRGVRVSILARFRSMWEMRSRRKL